MIHKLSSPIASAFLGLTIITLSVLSGYLSFYLPGYIIADNAGTLTFTIVCIGLALVAVSASVFSIGTQMGVRLLAQASRHLDRSTVYGMFSLLRYAFVTTVAYAAKTVNTLVALMCYNGLVGFQFVAFTIQNIVIAVIVGKLMAELLDS